MSRSRDIADFITEITDGTDTVETGYVINGSAKAWIHFDQSTTLVVDNSLNISSSTDVAGGKSSHNFTNSYANMFYTKSAGGANGVTSSSQYEAEAWAIDAGSFYVYGHWQTTAYDLQYVSATTLGDLA